MLASTLNEKSGLQGKKGKTKVPLGYVNLSRAALDGEEGPHDPGGKAIGTLVSISDEKISKNNNGKVL